MAEYGALRSCCTFKSGRAPLGTKPPRGSNQRPCRRAFEVIAPTPTRCRLSCSSGRSSNAPSILDPSIENDTAGVLVTCSIASTAWSVSAVSTLSPLLCGLGLEVWWGDRHQSQSLRRRCHLFAGVRDAPSTHVGLMGAYSRVGRRCGPGGFKLERQKRWNAEQGPREPEEEGVTIESGENREGQTSADTSIGGKSVDAVPGSRWVRLEFATLDETYSSGGDR